MSTYSNQRGNGTQSIFRNKLFRYSEAQDCLRGDKAGVDAEHDKLVDQSVRSNKIISDEFGGYRDVKSSIHLENPVREVCKRYISVIAREASLIAPRILIVLESV